MGSNNWALRVLMKKNVDLMGRKNQCRRDGRRFFWGGGGGRYNKLPGPDNVAYVFVFLGSSIITDCTNPCTLVL